MKQLKTLGYGIAVGVGLMYLFDPDRGRRRRAGAGQKLFRAGRKTREAIRIVSKDLQYRAEGLSAVMSHWISRGDVSDEVMAARVRSILGYVVRHPGSINVTARDRSIILTGQILADEVSRLLHRVRSVRGVRTVENRLDVHEDPQNIPGLQGKTWTRSEIFPPRPAVWSPTARFFAGTAGGLLTIYGISRRNAPGTVAAALGIGLLARGITNLDARSLIGLSPDYRAIDVNESITIAAPIKQVYDFWNHPENFPRFMRNVRDVQVVSEDRSHWSVTGPAGLPIEWDAVIYERIPNDRLAWTTRSGSMIAHGGVIQFRSNPDATTTVHITMSYDPIAGALGHAVARLFKSDPKSMMDEELMRMKTAIEKQATTSGLRSAPVSLG